MSAAVAMIDLDNTEFGTVLVSPAGKRFTMVDAGTDDAPASFAWLLPVDENGARTGGRRQRLYFGEAYGWTALEG